MVRPALTDLLLLGYCACARFIEVGVAGSLVFAASATLRQFMESRQSASIHIVRKYLL